MKVNTFCSIGVYLVIKRYKILDGVFFIQRTVHRDIFL